MISPHRRLLHHCLVPSIVLTIISVVSTTGCSVAASGVSESRTENDPRRAVEETVEEFFKRQDQMAQSCYAEPQVERLQEIIAADAENLVLQDVHWYRDLGVCQVGKTNILDIGQSHPSRSESELICRVEIDTASISFVRNGADHPRNPHSKQALIVTLTLDGSWKITDVRPS